MTGEKTGTEAMTDKLSMIERAGWAIARRMAEGSLENLHELPYEMASKEFDALAAAAIEAVEEYKREYAYKGYDITPYQAITSYHTEDNRLHKVHAMIVRVDDAALEGKNHGDND